MCNEIQKSLEFTYIIQVFSYSFVLIGSRIDNMKFMAFGDYTVWMMNIKAEWCENAKHTSFISPNEVFIRSVQLEQWIQMRCSMLAAPQAYDR